MVTFGKHTALNPNLEGFFSQFSKHIAGQHQTIKTPYHKSVRIIYADWAATGRAYVPIEERINKDVLPFMANPHSHANSTAEAMTAALKKGIQIIKQHVGANESDVLITAGSGMTGVINEFQRMLGFKIHETFKSQISLNIEDRPVVFITHMEHHSNQVSWLETLAEVRIVPPGNDGKVSIENFSNEISKFSDRKRKIAAITACSNVTGIKTPYYEIAELIHRENGFCFVDFTCAAPYLDIDMHPPTSNQYLDAVCFSPHKFLGGQGAPGILVFNNKLYNNLIPDEPGGGTVTWTNPWGEHSYSHTIETRESGGTPPLLQIIKTAMCVKLKNEMGVSNIIQREKQQLDILWKVLTKIPNLHILAANENNRLGLISFYIEGLNYNLAVRLLNDRFGIQARGGCSCAGTYGHFLLDVTRESSLSITSKIDAGDFSDKPGWVRLSIHPTQPDADITYIASAVEQLALQYRDWILDYNFDPKSGAVQHKFVGTEECSVCVADELFKEFI